MAKNNNKKINLAMVGMSENNGHPYSWSAICNGFDNKYMESCPFPFIYEYLNQEHWPEARIKDVKISHIWTQKKSLSNDIANAVLIPNVVNHLDDIIGKVDGVIIGRDDYDNHLKHSQIFLENGLPIFIDKPIAIKINNAENIFSMQSYDSQIFTCSSMRYSKEIILNENDNILLGNINYLEGIVPKSWEKYGIHVIEPIVSTFKDRGVLLYAKSIYYNNNVNVVKVKWDNLEAIFTSYGNYNSPISIKYYGSKNSKTKSMLNPFNSFKKSIESFIRQIRSNKNVIPRSETFEIIEIIEKGCRNGS